MKGFLAISATVLFSGFIIVESALTVNQIVVKKKSNEDICTRFHGYLKEFDFTDGYEGQWYLNSFGSTQFIIGGPVFLCAGGELDTSHSEMIKFNFSGKVELPYPPFLRYNVTEVMVFKPMPKNVGKGIVYTENKMFSAGGEAPYFVVGADSKEYLVIYTCISKKEKLIRRAYLFSRKKSLDAAPLKKMYAILKMKTGLTPEHFRKVKQEGC